MSSTPTASSTEAGAELREFTLWLLKALGCECASVDATIDVQSIPEPLRAKIGGDEPLQLTLSTDGTSDEKHAITPNSPIVRTLIDEVIATDRVGRAAPADQPESVRDVSQRLFDAYVIESGSVHLSGCAIEDRALLRVTCAVRSDKTGGEVVLRHHFVTATGEPLDPTLVERLGLRQLVPLTRTIRVTDDQCERWRAVGETVSKSLDPGADVECLLVTAVWCKYAEGKLAFVIGDATKSLAFSGWAQLFVDGSEKPPALACPSFSQGSHHIAATDDGEIVPIEAIASCSESGRRVLASNLETCVATQAKALPEYFANCNATGARVLRKALVACGTCQQSVSPTSVDGNRCKACRSLGRVSKDDPRMARVLGEYPKLDRWSRWQLAETTVAYILVAHSLARRLLIVVDKNDLGVLRLAKGSPFSKKWTETPEVDRAAYLC